MSYLIISFIVILIFVYLLNEKVNKKVKKLLYKHKKFIIITIAFIVFICISIFYMFQFKPANFEIGTLLVDNSFYFSFVASTLEDIIFFLIVGIAIFILSIQRPENEKLNARINTLFTNDDDVHKEILSDAKEKLLDLSIYSPQTILNLTIMEKKEFEGNSLLKIAIDRKVFLKSLIHDLDNFTTDGEIKLYGENSCNLPENIYGEINFIELMYTTDCVETFARGMQMRNLEFIHNFKENFKKDSKIVLHSNLWMWMKNNDVYEHSAYRATSNTIISVKNNIDDTIILKISDNLDSEIKRIEKNSNAIIITDYAMKKKAKVVLEIGTNLQEEN